MFVNVVCLTGQYKDALPPSCVALSFQNKKRGRLNYFQPASIKLLKKRYSTNAIISPLATVSPCFAHTATILPPKDGLISSIP